jgi:hypothetical protein
MNDPKVGFALSRYEINKGFAWRERAVRRNVETDTVLADSNGLSTPKAPRHRGKTEQLGGAQTCKTSPSRATIS